MKRKYFYRASSMGNLMTEGRSKADLLGETCKKQLAQVYAFSRANITKPIESKYLEKGHKREEMGITYLSLKEKKLYNKNEARISNEWGLTGLPDLYEGESILKASRIIDIKNSFSYISFLESKTEKLAKDRIWQAHTYMALTGAEVCDFAICAINAPIEMISDEKKRKFFKMNPESDQDEAFVKVSLEIERNMIFDLEEFMKEYPFAELETIRQGLQKDFVNITWDERINIVSVERDNYEIERMKSMIPHWDNYIEQTFEPKKP